jgi:uncharacterized protein YgiM (DUF1202 family)
MSWSGIFKFLLGIVLASAILLGSGVAAALYYISKVSVSPPKPVFANDKHMVKSHHSSVTASAKRKASSATKSSSSQNASPKPLEPGAYTARVTWSEGLILRSEPSSDASRVGGVAYKQKVVVLEESADKNWQRIRSEDGTKEGWVKAGNTDREG